MKLLSRVRLFATPWTVAHRLLSPRDFPGVNTGVGCHFLLLGIFPAQELNPGLPHCRQTLYWQSRDFLFYIRQSPNLQTSCCSLEGAVSHGMVGWDKVKQSGNLGIFKFEFLLQPNWSSYQIDQPITTFLKTMLCMKVKELLASQSCLTLCNPMDCGSPDPSVHGIL